MIYYTTNKEENKSIGNNIVLAQYLYFNNHALKSIFKAIFFVLKLLKEISLQQEDESKNQTNQKDFLKKKMYSLLMKLIKVVGLELIWF